MISFNWLSEINMAIVENTLARIVGMDFRVIACAPPIPAHMLNRNYHPFPIQTRTERVQGG